MDKLDLKGVTLEELHKFVEDRGEPRFRAAQILDWLYSQKTSHRVNTLQEMPNLGKTCIRNFSPLVYVTSLSIYEHFSSYSKASKDKSSGTVHKYIFKTEDNNLVPTVLIEDKLILSTQIGCTYNCKFCASGIRGLVRNLTTGEIVDQVVKVQNQLGSSSSVTKVELSGMGEPLCNYEAVMKAIEIIRSKWGLSLYLKNISVATCGVVPQIKALADSPLITDLVISFHAIKDELRSFLMPVNETYPIEMVLNAVRYYNKRTGRKVTFDYMLIEGLNDSIADTKILIDRLRGVPARLRISSFNPIPGSNFVASRLDWQEEFIQILGAGNVNAELGSSFGMDIEAGYGQLRTEKRKDEKTDKSYISTKVG